MIKNLVLSAGLYIFCFCIIGLYSVIIYILGSNLWPHQAGGSLILDKNNNIRGSYLLAQNLKSDKYFQSRPNKQFHDSCDVALYSTELKEYLISKYDTATGIYDITMLVPSASLHDPFITTREAFLQAPRISRNNKIKLTEVIELIDANSIPPIMPFFELDIVNVMHLNTKLKNYSSLKL